MKFENKVAIVTGGTRGIGRAISLALAREGAGVCVVGRNRSRADEVVAEIKKNGGEGLSIPADVSVESDVAAMVKQVGDRFSRVDILVNNAAVNLPYRAVTDLTLEEWSWIINVNLTGVFLCSKAVLPWMMAQKSGKIINLASLGGRYGAAGRSPYRATKAAVLNFTECLAAEVKEYGIDVNAICPGAVETDMMHEITLGKTPDYAMPPEDIARVAIFLASEESRSITGAAIDAYGLSNPIFGTSPAITRPGK